MATWSELPQSAHHVLELLLEVLTLQGRAVSEASRAVLTGARGGGKAARLARALVSS